MIVNNYTDTSNENDCTNSTTIKIYSSFSETDTETESDRSYREFREKEKLYKELKLKAEKNRVLPVEKRRKMKGCHPALKHK